MLSRLHPHYPFKKLLRGSLTLDTPLLPPGSAPTHLPKISFFLLLFLNPNPLSHSILLLKPSGKIVNSHYLILQSKLPSVSNSPSLAKPQDIFIFILKEVSNRFPKQKRFPDWSSHLKD